MVTVVCVESANVYKGHIVIIEIRYFLRADLSTLLYKLFVLNIM